MSDINSLLQKRKHLLGTNLPTFYDEPIHIVKGKDVWLWDKKGNKYLDCYNNVPHVGHCHPTVVEAISKQSSTLNTHTRYVHEGILDYVEKLTATFSENITTAIMTCTGSEANDIAMRMAMLITGSKGIITTNHTYHGNTYLVSQLSQTNIPPESPLSSIRHIPAPDSYRNIGSKNGNSDSEFFAQELEKSILNLKKSNHGFSALVLCPFFANEGFPSLNHGWLNLTEKIVKRYNGLIIADEVQPGFGRLGSNMWSHQAVGLSPDIITLGKPMGNGYPVGAVVTSNNIMNAFRNSYRYFNTFGGNPVACAASMAVLRVIEEECLIRNASSVGDYCIQKLKDLSMKYDIIGDVRGSGLFFGAEMVLDRKTKKPAKKLTKEIINRMRHKGILISKLGIHDNTLKIRPPMTFSMQNADLLINKLDEVFKELNY